MDLDITFLNDVTFLNVVLDLGPCRLREDQFKKDLKKIKLTDRQHCAEYSVSQLKASKENQGGVT